MSLETDLNRAPLLRPLGLARNIRNICLITLEGDLKYLSGFVQKYPDVTLGMLIVPDLPEDRRLKYAIEYKGKKLKVERPDMAGKCPDLEKVFLSSLNAESCAAYLSQICVFLASMNVRTIWIETDNAPAHTLRAPYPEFFLEHMRELEKARELFADDFSRQTFTGRLKAILTGNAAYVPVAAHSGYFHPLVQPQNGDIMIDGGVSDMVGSQIEFANAVGEKGRIFGFEPIPSMAEKAAKQLAPWPIYRLIRAGLAKEPCVAMFEDLRDSSHIVTRDRRKEGMIPCELQSIDAFCKKNHLGRINCIKLDVEGAELQALQGGEEVIRKCKPKLIVCLYHNPQDMYEIPLWLREIGPDYKFYLAHSSCQFMDTILYARAD